MGCARRYRCFGTVRAWRRGVAFALVAAVLLAGADARGADEVVAQIDDLTLFASDYREYAARPGASRSTPESLLEQLINDTLLAREGRRSGLGKDPRVTAAGKAAKRRAAAERLIEREIVTGAKVDEEQLRALYHAGADTARLQMIVLATEADAQAALDRLRAGADLREEAKHSYDRAGAAAGGDLGVKTRAQMDPAAAKAIFSAPIGQLVGPVKMALGFAVLRVLERRIGDEAGFAERRADLRKFAEAQARAMGRRHFVEQLRKQEKVSVDEPFLRSTGTRIDATAAEAAHVVATIGGEPLRYDAVLAEMRRLVGAKTGRHMSGTAVKLEFAWALVDRMLLEDAALSRGHGKSAEARLAERSGRRDAIVRLLAERLRANGGTKAVRAEIQRLRSRARIKIDRAALARVATGSR